MGAARCIVRMVLPAPLVGSKEQSCKIGLEILGLQLDLNTHANNRLDIESVHMQVYTVQTHAIQQYSLPARACLPGVRGEAASPKMAERTSNLMSSPSGSIIKEQQVSPHKLDCLPLPALSHMIFIDWHPGHLRN